MDLERFIPAKNLDLDFEVVKASDEVLKILIEYLGFDREIQKIEQMYQIMLYNLNDILDKYILKANDTFERKVISGFSDFISINALVINYISSAKALVEAIEKFNKSWHEDAGLAFKKDYISKTYDDSFYYRLVNLMRNFSQHGNLPISVREGRCGFDLKQILKTKHFHFNAKTNEEIEKIADEIHEKYGDNPVIVFTLTISKYTCDVISIYNEFLKYNKSLALQIQSREQLLLKQIPELIVENEIFPSKVVCFVEENELHVFDANADVVYLINEYQKSVEEELEYELNEYENLRVCIK